MEEKTPDTKPEHDAEYSRIQAGYDRKFNDPARTLQDQERQAGTASSASPLASSPKETAADNTKNINDVKEGEQSSNSWRNNVSRNQAGSGSKRESFANKLKSNLVKRGPVGLISGGLLGLGAGLGFFGLSLLPITITEHFTNDANDVNASQQRKSIYIIGKKLGGDAKKKMSVCNSVVSIRCKFNSMNKSLIERYEKEGFKFGDKTINGDRVGFSSIEFPGGAGTARSVTELNAILRNSVVAAASFNAVYSLKNSIFVVGGWFKNVLGALNLTKAKKIEGKTQKEVDKSFEDSVKGEKGTVTTESVNTDDREGATEEEKKQNEAKNEAGNETERQINDAISKGSKLKRLALKITNALAIPQLICLTYNMVNYISIGRKTKLAVKFATFAMTILTAAQAIRANIATDKEVEKLTSILAPSKYPTKIEDPSTGQMIDNPHIGKNALDSAAYAVVARGDKRDLKKEAGKFFVGGGGFFGVLEKAVNWINENLGRGNVRTACKIVNNRVVQVLSFLAAPLITGAFMLLEQILPIEEWAAGLVNAAIDAGAGADLTNVAGVDAGNLLFIGTAVIMGKTSMKYGLKPGKLDAIRKNMADNNELLEREIAMNTYIASKTPFDITNRYSFLGSMAVQAATYMPNINQPVMSSLGKIFSSIPSSLNLLNKDAMAAYSMPVPEYTEARFSQCDDEVYAGWKDKFDTDMGCGLRGVPDKEQDSDTVLNFMESNNQIDKITGKPVAGSYYEKYKKYCVDREDPMGMTSVAAEEQTDDPKWYTGEQCYEKDEKGNSSLRNNMASEYVGYRTSQGVMDGENFDEDTGSAPQATTGPATGDAKELALKVANNPNIIFAKPQTKTDLENFSKSGTAVNSCGDPFTLDAAFLGTMQTLSSKYKIFVGNIGFRDDRSVCYETDQHVKGAAVDINGIEVINGGKTNWGRIRFTPEELPIISSYANDWLATLAPNRGGVGQKGCINGAKGAGGFAVTPPPGATGINGNLHFDDECTHLHIDARVR